MKKQSAKQRPQPAATEVFRQFAWYLAGSLAASRGAARPAKKAGR